MSRNLFGSASQVPVTELLLDTHNPRIRHGQDQNDCIARILRDRTNFLNLLKDIATNGLSPEHILVSRDTEGKWVVRDGNRRITALKFLNRPDLGKPDAALVQTITRIAQAANGTIPAAVDCLTCDDEATILAYLERKHTGENEGVGQVTWSALLKSLFNLQLGISDQNKRSAQLVLWVEERGMVVDDEFPLTNLTRILDTEVLGLIGFRVENDSLAPTLTENQSFALAARVIRDIASGRVNVKRDGSEGSIYEIDAQMRYIRNVREELGPTLNAEGAQNNAGTSQPTKNENASPASTSSSSQDSGNSQGNSAGSGSGQTNSSQQSEADRKPSSPATPSWERPCLFVRKHPGFGLPSGHTKVADLITEIKNLKVKDTPHAVALVFRTLIELSEQHYRRTNSLQDKDAFHKNIAAAADHMKTAGLLTDGQHDVVIRNSRNEGGMLHVKTLHGYVHSEHFHPNYQTLNTLWSEIDCFVAACWTR